MQTAGATKTKLLSRFFYLFFSLCFIIPLFTSCSSSKIIVNALDEREANEILVFLASKGIEAVKVQSKGAEGGGASKVVLWDIQVSEMQANEAMALLNQSGLPRRRGQSLLSIFATSGLVPSEMQEQIRYQAGLAEQIASTIRKIDGVLDAEVQVSFPKDDPLNPSAEKKQKITASVYVKHSGVLDDPNSHLITKIKRLVTASITGLDYDNVTVIADRARYGEATGAGLFTGIGDEEKQYVSVWTLTLAKESLTRFRILFFSFISLLLLLLLSLIWVGWKLYPLLEAHGGVKELFHLKPIEAGKVESKPEEPASETTESPESSEKTDEEKGLIDKDIDET